MRPLACNCFNRCGFNPPGGELDAALIERGRLFVESYDAFAPPPVGSAELQGLERRSIDRSGRPLHAREVYDFLESKRQASNGEIGYLVGKA